MGKKMMLWKTKGMNQDLSVSAFNPEFSFENMNLRLSTNEGNTLMSWVNERGTEAIEPHREHREYWSKQGEQDVYVDPHDDSWTHHAANSDPLSIDGITIGTAVLNKKLVLFTTGSSSTDRIYSLYRDDSDGTYMGKVLFSGHLNFAADCPLETLVSYESEDIQKVYWVDGRNQPRVINIAAASVTGESEVYSGFDFVPATFKSNTTFTVVNNGPSGGLFAPGVIQYCFTYLNKYGQESNVVEVSPIYYLAHSDRGASPEDKVTNSFTITITNPNTGFGYVRIYSIQRTSLNLEPFVKLLDDIPVPASGNITYTDNGTTGATVDPSELLFVGGKEITAGTLMDKDGTLFLGDIEQTGATPVSIIDYYRNNPTEADSLQFAYKTALVIPYGYGIYDYTNQLNKNMQEITTFKGKDKYRFGIQLQKETGEWTEPIFMKDLDNDLYPSTTVDSTNGKLNIQLVKATANIPAALTSGYKKVRPVIVYPNISERNVLCQGVLNPTVFNVIDRIDNSPYAQPSWYFRPFISGNESSTGTTIDADSLKDVKVNRAMAEGDNYEIHPYFHSHGYSVQVYVMTARIPVDAENTILSRGTLKATHWKQVSYTEATQDTDNQNILETLEFDFRRYGAIKLGEFTSGSTTVAYKYAFVSDEPFKQNFNELRELTPFEWGYQGESIAYQDGVTLCRTSDVTFTLTNTVRTNNEHKMFFSHPSDFTEPGATTPYFRFYFNDGSDYYEVELTSAGTTESFDVDTATRAGNIVRFTHYDSLYSHSDLLVGDVSDSAKQIEIQGSRNVFSGPFDSANPTKYFSNTQFMVDQSIVTLNSPDIEFDTEVQRYGNEGLRLRVIGAIPITATVSSFDIKTSSNMMELDHHGNSSFTTFGRGKLDYKVWYNNSVASNNGAGKRLVSNYLWNDAYFENDSKVDDKIKTRSKAVDYLIHPWQRVGSLSNDTRTQDTAASWLKTKRESNMLFSCYTKYLSTSNFKEFEKIGTQIVLTENDEVMNYRLPRQSTGYPDINYYANIDKVLYNERGYPIIESSYNMGQETYFDCTSPISLKYKSTSHAVIVNTANNGTIQLLPYWDATTDVGEYSKGSGKPFWAPSNAGNLSFSQEGIDPGVLNNFLWLGELYKTPSNYFGDTKTNRWIIAGKAVNVRANAVTPVEWTEGDTYYQRYDCLKTYPFTEEDTNQMVEILSFMCETHVNIDGRYDRNRGQVDNTRMRPRNFNLLNPVYSQRNNFFTYRQLDHEGETSQSYPNHVAYSMSKNSTAERDEWTHVTLANILELDGDKGKLNKLTRFNDQLLAFQDTGISQILYNENTAISSTAGVPIEIANSGKVTGKRYLSDTIGCKNKWSMVNTPTGIYFMDDHDKSVYLFNGQLENLSTKFGFNSWCKKEMTGDVWEPSTFKGFLGCYDKQNQDVLFVNDTKALAFSEKIGAFTSFYDYGKGMLKNLEGEGIWGTNNVSAKTTSLWGHQKGSYGRFFGENKPYWMTLVGNPEPQVDKMFTNLEFRACVDGEGVETESQQTEPSFGFLLPFDELEVWNEYQHGIAELKNKNGHEAMIHHRTDSNESALKRKFRIWRCDIPRDNVAIPVLPAEPTEAQQEAYDTFIAEETKKGIYRIKARPLDRIRNTWVYLKLMKNAETGANTLPRTEVHDMGLGYF